MMVTRQARPPLALVAIGSNLGDAAGNVLAAMDRLDALAAKPARRSSLWRSEPVDCPPGSPPFINAAVAFVPAAGATPESLLDELQRLEHQFGRRAKQVLNEPRPLDLDLIAFGAEVRSTHRLILPHPRAHLRRFVLAPLREVAPGFILPGRRRTLRELLAALPPDRSARRV